jgi:hypothetical protein
MFFFDNEDENFTPSEHFQGRLKRNVRSDVATAFEALFEFQDRLNELHPHAVRAVLKIIRD